MERGIELSESIGGQIGFWKILSYLGEIVKDEYGVITNKLVGDVEGYNLITNVGKGFIMERLYGNTPSGPLSRTGVGTSQTAAAVGNTSLTGGVFKVFDAPAVKTGLTTVSETTFGPNDANFPWYELGLDNTTTLFNRIVLDSPIGKSNKLSIIVIVGITQV